MNGIDILVLIIGIIAVFLAIGALIFVEWHRRDMNKFFEPWMPKDKAK